MAGPPSYLPEGAGPGFAPVDGAQGVVDRQINLRDLWPPIYRSRYVILAIFGVALAAAIVITFLIRPTYRGVATIEIKQEAQKVLGTEEAQESGGGATDASRFLETQVDIIGSRAVAQAVAQSLGFFSNDHFLELMNVDATAKTQGILTPVEAKRELVIDTLRRNLAVALSDETRIANVSFNSPDPRLAAQVANSFGDNYIRMNLERRFDASRYSLDFLRRQLREAQNRLSASERRALAYARSTRVVDASNGAVAGGAAAPRSVTIASLVQLNDALSLATGRRISAERKWRQVNRVPVMQIPEVLANPAVQELAQSRADLRSRYQEQLEYRREENPLVKQAGVRISELDRQIDTLSGDIRDGLRSDYLTAVSQEAGLRQRVEQLKGTALDEQDRSVQLSIVQREANTNRGQFDALLSRYNQLNAQAGVQLNNLAIVDLSPVPTRPVWPSLPLNLALAMILAGIAAAAYVFLRENLFVMVRTPDDVTERLGLPVLGSVPASGEVIQDLGDSKSAISEAFSTIRTGLSLSVDGLPSSMMFTSTQAGEGKTTACYGVAVSLAKIGRRVLVIDADLRRPNVHRVFGTSNERGLSNVLADGTPVEKVAVVDATTGIHVLAGGPIPPNPAELLATGKLAQLIKSLEERYDHVLIDSAPLLGLADAPLVATSAQVIIFVIESARSNMRWIVSALARLKPTGVPIAGVVLSRFDPGRSGYSFDYKYDAKYAYAVD